VHPQVPHPRPPAHPERRPAAEPLGPADRQPPAAQPAAIRSREPADTGASGFIPVPLSAPVFSDPAVDGGGSAPDHQRQRSTSTHHSTSQEDVTAGQNDAFTWGDDDNWPGTSSQANADSRPDNDSWAGHWTDDDSWGDESVPIHPRPPGLAPGTAARTAVAQTPPASHPWPNGSDLLDPPPPARPGQPRTGRGMLAGRVAPLAVPVIVVVTVAAVALTLLTGHGPRSGPLAASRDKAKPTAVPGLPLTPITLATYPGQQERGVFQTVNRVVASGQTIVTMGSQTSGGLVRQQFFVSVNGGASWRLAPVHAPGGGQAALGHAATLLAGGPGGWVAVGPQAVWTSPDGTSWTLASTNGISPQLPGDSVWVVTKTAQGFLAAGSSEASGKPQAVLWTSRNGVTWQRETAAQLRLAGPGETVEAIAYASYHGPDTVISGTVSARGQTYDAAWLSTSGGASWTRVTVPADHGAGTVIAGLGFDSAGLIAVRPGRAADGADDGIAYFSPNGLSWQYAATIGAAAGWTPGVVKGSQDGFVVTGTSAAGQLTGYTSTGTGASWLPTAPLGSAASESVVGATVAQAGTIVAVGYTAKGQLSQQPVFLLADTAGRVRSVPLTGATLPELAVNGTAVAGDVQVAVGSANGYPAVWRKVAGGSWALVSSMALAGADPALRSLTSVTHGAAGWLAVGAPGPVIATSADGTAWGVAGGNITQDLAGVSALAAASGPAGYVIVGKLVAPGGSCVADVWWSQNLTSWTRAHDVNDATGSSQVLAVAASAHGFISAGSHEGKPALWITADGRSWKTIVLSPPAGVSHAVLQQVAVNGSRVVALGQVTDSAGAPAGAPFAEFSADGGAHWRQVPFSAPGPGTVVTALTAGASGFTAAGLVGQGSSQDVALWSSANGASWGPPQSSGPHGTAGWQVTALTRSGTGVTGIGLLVTQQSQQMATLNLPAR
jgi:hypothetical protein